MAVELKVPSLGMDMEEATVVRWIVADGDKVEKGDPVLEIDTDKTSFEIEANADGEIRNLRGDEGETIPVGTTLAYIATPGEEVPEREVEPVEASAAEANGVSGSPAPEVAENKPDSALVPNGRGVRASPAARRAALKKGIPIEEVPGSGPHGRVYLSDVLETEAPEARPEPETTPEPPSPPSEDGITREPLSRIRRLGAERTARSFAEVPHFYLTRDMEAGRLLELRKRLGEKMDLVPSINELLALAVARTLQNHPRLNSRYEDGESVVNPRVNLGMAVATDAGLVVPVLKGADTLRLRELVPAVKDLVKGAREGKLGLEDLSGGTFTISNLGMMGIDSFDAVINTPEAAILAVGRVRTVPEWRDGEWLPHQVISMTLSVDHRTADGADGSRFLADLQESLLEWELLM